jgi:hypothetical protein
VAGLFLMAELFLMARGIRLILMIQIKSESFVAGLFLMDRCYLSSSCNSDKNCIFYCWAIVDEQGLFESDL